MAKGKTSYHRIPAEFKYAKVFESNRDMGNVDSGGNVDFRDIDGQYQLTAVIDEATKDQMIASGVPEVSLGYQQFKAVEDGKFEYRFKRPHKSKKLKNDDGSAKIMGPPELVDLPASEAKMEAEGGSKLWEHLVYWPEDKFIGNGSSGFVKYQVYKGQAGRTIVTLESVGIVNHVEFEPSNDDNGPAF